jgi:hypothetical protein
MGLIGMNTRHGRPFLSEGLPNLIPMPCCGGFQGLSGGGTKRQELQQQQERNTFHQLAFSRFFLKIWRAGSLAGTPASFAG